MAECRLVEEFPVRKTPAANRAPKMIDTPKPTVDLPSDSSLRLSIPGRVSLKLKSIAKRVLPQGWVEEIRQIRSFSKNERPLYLRVRFLDRIKQRRRGPRQLTKPVRSLLFVCFGNIMRSPMCEALMNRALAEVRHATIRVLSAGSNAIPGRPAHPWAIEAARELGISLENHRARPLSAELLNDADIVFVMDYKNRVQLLMRYPEMDRKVMMLSAYAGSDHRCAEIRDPYYEDLEATRRCYEILRVCICNLAADLLTTSNESILAAKKC